MTEMLVISNIVLWVLVIVLALVVLALARQVGILHERVAPAGALQPTEGPKVGELTEAMALESLAGENVSIGGSDADGLATLVLFISPTCPVCKSLVPTAKSLAKRESKRMRLIFASDGDRREQHEAYANDLQLDDYPYVLSQSLGMAYQVSKLPFALLIAADGSLQSKGLVNTREHLESLVEAMDSGIATLQDYVMKEQSL
ncbi:MAG: methylamine dehydrogenase accessory protein MauD [Woeseiaceae bacterium]